MIALSDMPLLFPTLLDLERVDVGVGGADANLLLVLVGDTGGE